MTVVLHAASIGESAQPRMPKNDNDRSGDVVTCFVLKAPMIRETSALKARKLCVRSSYKGWTKYGAVMIAAWLIAATAHAGVIIEVSEDFVAIEQDANRIVSRQKPYATELPRIAVTDSYAVLIGRVPVPMNVEVRDDVGGQPGKRSLVRFAESSLGGALEVPPGLPGNATLVVAPEQDDVSARLRLRVLRHGIRSHESRVQTIRFLRESIDRIERVYRVPTITLRVRPCGVVNAFSAPDITVCTELIDTMYRHGWHDAIRVVLYHELAHSLLRLWGLPEWKDENLADEFAVLQASDSPRAIEQISLWFEERNPLQAAAAQVQMGGGHAMPAVRARNARAALANRDRLRLKWDQLLAGFRRTS